MTVVGRLKLQWRRGYGQIFTWEYVESKAFKCLLLKHQYIRKSVTCMKGSCHVCSNHNTQGVGLGLNLGAGEYSIIFRGKFCLLLKSHVA